MQVNTDPGFVGAQEDGPYKKYFERLFFSDGTYCSIPHGFFRDWLGNDIAASNFGNFYIGKCSGFGIGSQVKYDGGYQSLRVGRFVSGGLRIKFLLNGQHPVGTISTCLFSSIGLGLKNVPMPQYGDTVIKNDVWIGDEALFLGGACIEDGCIIGARSVIPPNFKTEPYGIYAGSPAKLIRYRFSENIRKMLLELSWWDMPIQWIKENNSKFLIELDKIEEKDALAILQELIDRK